MDEGEASSYRMIVARFNCLALGRPGLQYSVKGGPNTWLILRGAICPCSNEWGDISRQHRDLSKTFGGAVKLGTLQSSRAHIGQGTWTPGKAPQGGVCTAGAFAITSWPLTRQVIVLISEEARSYALLTAHCKAIGTQRMAHDIGIAFKVAMSIHAGAALAISNKVGLSDLHHSQGQHL